MFHKVEQETDGLLGFSGQLGRDVLALLLPYQRSLLI